MASYVAFLRGMNLGRRRIKNDELCACFEKIGLSQVSAFLASGNVLFTSKQRAVANVEQAIEKGLKEQLHYDVPTFLRSAKQVGEIAQQQPFDGAALKTSGKLQVALLQAKPKPTARKAALRFATRDDRLAIIGRELYWLPKGSMSASELDVAGLAKVLGPMTIRTHRTMTRLLAKLEAL
jgi:uncharacterized protein (DUF1697 family)